MEALQDGFSLGRVASRSRCPIRSTDAPPEDVTLKQENKEQSTTANKKKGKKGEASYMLLYLNNATFVGERGELFAQEVRFALANGFLMVMMHENDVLVGGCEFAHFFVTTPQDLINDGLYMALACAWYPDPFRQVSVAHVALAFGAEELTLAKEHERRSMRVVSEVQRLGIGAASPAMELTESLSMSMRMMTMGGLFRRSSSSSTNSSVEVSAPSTTIAPAVKPLDPEAQAGVSAADFTPSIAGTLYMRLPVTCLYKKVMAEVFGKAEGAVLCYEDLKGGNLTELRGSSIEKVEAVNPKMLEFALLTKKSSPERGRSYFFRVSTHADFARWMSGLELWIESTRKSSDSEVAGSWVVKNTEQEAVTPASTTAAPAADIGAGISGSCLAPAALAC